MVSFAWLFSAEQFLAYVVLTFSFPTFNCLIQNSANFVDSSACPTLVYTAQFNFLIESH